MTRSVTAWQPSSSVAQRSLGATTLAPRLSCPRLRLRNILLRIDERLLHHRRRPVALLRHRDDQRTAELAVLGRHHGVADVLLEARRVQRARDLADHLAALLDRPLAHVEVERITGDLDADQLLL